MSEPDIRPKIALLATPEVTASTLYGMYDLFAAAGRDWDFITKGAAGAARLVPVVVASRMQPFRAINGVWIAPESSLDDCRQVDVVCVPELFVAPGESLRDRFAAEIRWLRECYETGAMVATACSGALLLAETGLLDGFDATTHWGYCDALAQGHPKVKVRPGRALVTAGEGQNMIMAGGGTSWQDLALFIIARLVGVDEAMHVARIYLIDWHDIGQQPYAALTRACQFADAQIAQCQEWVAEHYAEDAPVAAMTRLSGLPERSFKRRFSSATGMSPMEYVHTLRVEEAKQMLETTTLPVEAVASDVGYEDASFFGRLFRRKVGLTPAQYRKRFRTMREALQAGLAPARR